MFLLLGSGVGLTISLALNVYSLFFHGSAYLSWFILAAGFAVFVGSARLGNIIPHKPGHYRLDKLSEGSSATVRWSVRAFVAYAYMSALWVLVLRFRGDGWDSSADTALFSAGGLWLYAMSGAILLRKSATEGSGSQTYK